MQVRREWVYKNAEFPQLVSSLRLSSGDCLKFVQVALLFKQDVIHLKSISNAGSNQSAEKIMLLKIML